MRRLILGFLAFPLAFALIGCGSSVPLTEDRFAERRTYEVDKTKNEIYVAVQDWAVRKEHSDEGLKYNDKKAGKIGGKVSMPMKCNKIQTHITVVSNLVVDIKDRAYRVEINPYKSQSQAFNIEGTKIGGSCKDELNESINEWFSDIEDHVRRYDSDW